MFRSYRQPYYSLHLLIILLICSTCFGQNTETASSTEEIEFIVSVWDEDRNFIKNLSTQNFEFSEGKKRYPAVSATRVTKDISIGLVIDQSGSLGAEARRYGLYDDGKDYPNWMPSISSSLVSFVESSDPATGFLAVTFGKETLVTLSHTADRTEIINFLRDLANAKPDGTKIVTDGLSVAFKEISKARSERRVLVVVTDGDHPVVDYDKIVELSRSLKIPIYVVLVPTSDDGFRELGFKISRLSAITDEGGILAKTDGPETVKEAFRFLAAELKNHYAVRFRLEKSAKTPKWRTTKISVNTSTVRPAPRGKITVRAPKKFLL